MSFYFNTTDGCAFPGLTRLAVDLRVNERTVRRLIGELKASGFLEKKRGGWGRSNRYYLSFVNRTVMSNQEATVVRANLSTQEDTDRTAVSNQEVDRQSPDRTNLSLLIGPVPT